MRKNILFICCLLLLFTACKVKKTTEIDITIIVTNPLPFERVNEIVEISKNDVYQFLEIDSTEQFIILDEQGKQVPYQIATNSPVAKSVLIFPVTIGVNDTLRFKLKKGKPETIKSKVYGRLVPERKDDFTWENDKIAFRVYGPALQETGEVSNGIDVWAKRTDKLVIDKWYADELSGKSSYHHDNGEGLDMYKVGASLGAGATSPFVSDKLWFSKNFTDYEILDKGPFRFTVKLNYASYKADTINVSETRTISLDAGSHYNRVCMDYNIDTKTIAVGTGIVLRNSSQGNTFISKDKSYFVHKEPVDEENGTIYESVIGTEPFNDVKVSNGHLVGLHNVQAEKPYVYYAGAGWSKSDFKTFEDWKKHTDTFSMKINNPLKVEITKSQNKNGK